jgi:hypothetical protein
LNELPIIIPNNHSYASICVKQFIVLIDDGSLYAMVKKGEEYILIKFTTDNNVDYCVKNCEFLSMVVLLQDESVYELNYANKIEKIFDGKEIRTVTISNVF